MATSKEATELATVFNNSSLFSNHYLKEMIQMTPEWGDEAHLSETYIKIKEIFDRKGKHFERYVEAELEHNWIRPVFDILGNHYGVQESLHNDPLKPDYAFFPDKETLDEAYAQEKGTEDFYKKAVAVGDAKAWNVLLDKSRQGKARREMTNPSYQIDVYLRATPPKWAILTNGKLWRLYHEDTSVKMDHYYEINLPELISKIEQTGDITPFKYFYLFFRLEAFPKVPLGSSFLDRVREESTAYAQKIGKDLQENVYRAMKVLAEGFFAEPSNTLSLSEGDIRDVQDNSLRLLYRLLFISYAESRKLLDTYNKHYKGMSLRKLKEEIANKIDQDETLLAVQSTYWEGLKDLFRLINDGSEAFGYPKNEFYIPAYNGGLFDSSKNFFLAQKRIGNSYLAEAIDLLARSQSEKGKVFVDYSSLDIRHLGSIYEGILEYKLHLAEEPMVAVKEKGREVWLPKREAAIQKFSDSVEAGRLYLVTDKGERKATGSFYTPEYIVKYIVKNTLAPLIDPMMEEAMWAEELRKDLLKKLLSLKVLDPAMGSGHFLVEATDYIAREIIHAKEIARREDLDSYDVAENDIHWARREVVRNCIYGVDLNPMAVELAKLSLWLTTVAANKPLSFLDHHLRCGNSLIGTELDKLMILPNSKRDPGQLPMWPFVLRQQKEHTEDLLKRYAEMAAQPDDDLNTVKEKEKKYAELREEELSRRLTDLADIWLSTFFGNEVDEEEYQELQNYLSPRRFLDWSEFRTKEWFARAKKLASEKRFFHWELEFPEAFAGKKNAGFDVVIGNPPYDELSEEAWGRKIDEMPYFQETEHLIPALGYRVNIYRLFISQALKLTRPSGWHGFIVPLSLLADQFTLSLRRYLLEMVKFRLIEQFSQKDDPHNRVFLDAKLSTCLYVVQNELPKENNVYVRSHPGREILSSSPNYTTSQFNFSNFDKENLSIPGLTQSSWDLILKFASSKDFLPLGNVAKALPGELMINHQFDPYISDAKNGEEVIRGSHIGMYQLIKPKQGEPLYFNREKYLSDHANSKKAFHHLQIRVVYQRYAAIDNFRRLISTILPQNYFCSHTVGYLDDINQNYNLGFLLALLNSELLDWRFNLTSTNNNINGYEVEALPLPAISFSTPAPERARLVVELKELYQASKFGEILAIVEACLPKDAPGNFISEQEKSDVVHDLLALLAEQMLKMNKQKQLEIKGFLGWLEGEVGAKVEDLTPKTKVQEYYKLQFDELLAILKKNKRKIAIDPARREPQEKLKQEFAASVDKLKPLMKRITDSDDLIDEIVYRLYGLAQEEVEIVKKGAG